MTTHSGITSHARFERLVRAYPSGRRRDELLDTLLMAAADGGRSRPTGREVVDVLRHAPRAWLGRPGSRGVVVVAAVVALLTSLLTGCLAARASASAQYRPLPPAATVTDLGALIAPGVALRTERRYDRPVAVVDGETRYGFVSLYARHDATIRDTRSFTQGVVTRLRQAGWTTTWLTEAPRHSPDDDLVVAAKAGVVLHMDTVHWGNGPSDGAITITVQRTEPDSVLVAAGIGAALGLLLGWLLTGWASRRTEHHPWAGDALAALTALTAVTIAPWAWATIRQVADELSGDVTYRESPFWGWTVFGGDATVLTAPAVLAIVAAAVVTARARPNRGPGTTPRTARRLPSTVGAAALAAAVISLLGLYLVGFSLPFLGDTVTLVTLAIMAVAGVRAGRIAFRRTTTPPADVDR